jgi:hypothetical protein
MAYQPSPLTTFKKTLLPAAIELLESRKPQMGPGIGM